MAKIRPLGDKLLVRRAEAATVSKGGILLPDSAKEKPKQGTVVAVGNGRIENGQRIPLDVKKGEVVLFSAYAGSDVNVDGESLLMLSEGDVFGVVE